MPNDSDSNGLIEGLEIDVLTPDPMNARKRGPRAEGMLVKSLQEVGASRSVVIDEEGRILAGNGTVQAAAEAGITKLKIIDADGETIVAVRRSGLTEEQKRRLAILDNRTGELAEWDPEVLRELTEAGLLVNDLWSEEEFDALMSSLNAPSGEGGGGEGGNQLLTDPDSVPDEVVTRCKLGDVWQLGAHRLMCGDSLNPEDVTRLMDGKTPNMVWADPPYGISIVAANGYVGGGEAYDIPFGGVKNAKKTKGDKKGSVGGAKPFGPKKDIRGSDRASNIIEVGKYAPVIGDDTTETAVRSSALCLEYFPDAVQIWWGGNYYADNLPASSCWLVWDKENTGNFADCELAWTNQKTAVRLFRHMWNGLMKDSERGERRVHPTQKPVALAEWAFEKYGSQGDIVFDPFVGSGMSLIAAERLGRAVYGSELSEEYCDIILARWEAATGKQAELVSRIERTPDDSTSEDADTATVPEGV